MSAVLAGGFNADALESQSLASAIIIQSFQRPRSRGFDWVTAMRALVIDKCELGCRYFKPVFSSLKRKSLDFGSRT